jgi:cobalt-zinc-cadmium resistance protein CzcA
VHGAEDTFTLKNEGVQYLKVAVDRLAAGRFGLNVDDIQNDLQSPARRPQCRHRHRPGARVPVVLRGPAQPAQFAGRFRGPAPELPGGGSVPLASVARIERVDGPVKVDRENAQRYVVVQSNVRDRDLVGFVEEAKAASPVTSSCRTRLPAGLGRPVREPAARGGTPDDRGAGRAGC